MAVNYGVSIVTDGLNMLLDAANTRSYPGSGTAWNDISGNGNNATLTASPTYSSSNLGYFAFNGTSQYATATNNITVSAYSIICWIYSAGSQPSFAGLCQYRNGSPNWGLGCSYGTPVTNQLGYSWGFDSSTYNWNSGLIIPNNQWVMVAISATTTSATLYLNLVSATNVNTQTSFNFNGFSIANDGLSRLFYGNMSSVLFYNQALSAAQIAQNFNAYRGRYGI